MIMDAHAMFYACECKPSDYFCTVNVILLLQILFFFLHMQLHAVPKL